MISHIVLLQTLAFSGHTPSSIAGMKWTTCLLLYGYGPWTHGDERSIAYRNCQACHVFLNGSVTASAVGVIPGIPGHGFLIASDSLTKHPSGPGIDPA